MALVVSYEKMCITNIADLNENLKSHSHGKTDSSIILHALDITSSNLLTELVVYRSNTDVLFLLLHYFDDICSSIILCPTSRDIHIRSMHTHLGPELCSYLLGFHTVTGCDQKGRFCGYGKPSCWKVLMNASKKVSNSLRSLGEQDITDDVTNGLEEFVLDLSCKERTSEVNSLASLSWYLFSR